jgi:hypothetical protein
LPAYLGISTTAKANATAAMPATTMSVKDYRGSIAEKFAGQEILGLARGPEDF